MNCGKVRVEKQLKQIYLVKTIRLIMESSKVETMDTIEKFISVGATLSINSMQCIMHRPYSDRYTVKLN